MALALCCYDEPTALHYVRYSAGSAPRARQAWGAAADYSLERHHRWTEAEAATLARLCAAAGCMQTDQSRAPAPASPCGGRIAADDAEVAELLARMKHAATCRCSDDFGKMWGRIDRCGRRVPVRMGVRPGPTDGFRTSGAVRTHRSDSRMGRPATAARIPPPRGPGSAGLGWPRLSGHVCARRSQLRCVDCSERSGEVSLAQVNR